MLLLLVEYLDDCTGGLVGDMAEKLDFSFDFGA